MRHRSLVGAPLLLLILVLVPPRAWAQNDAVLRPIASVDGKRLYTAYCVQCHGADGKGGGPRAAGLQKPPLDLTQIAARHEGKYSREWVSEYIQGVRPGGKSVVDRATGKVVVLMEDGSKADMPSWKNLFRRWWPDENERLRFGNLAKYLESIQEK